MTYTYCPDCGCKHVLIEVTTRVRVTFSGPGDYEESDQQEGYAWDGDSKAQCGDCGYCQTFDKFEHDEEYVGPFGVHE